MATRQVIHRSSTVETYRALLAVWLDTGLNKPDKTNSELGRLLGVGPSEVSKMRRDKNRRRILADQLFIISAYIEEPIPQMNDTSVVPPPRSIPILGEAGRQVWYEEDPIPDSSRQLPYIPNDRYGELSHFATRIVGDATNVILPEGAYAIYVPYWDARKHLTDKDFVLFKHRAPVNGMHKRLIRQVHFTRDRLELRAASTSDKINSERIKLNADGTRLDGTDDPIEIVGLIVWQCGPVGL